MTPPNVRHDRTLCIAVGRNCRIQRWRKRYTQVELSDLLQERGLSVSAPMIGLWESGLRTGINVDYLYGLAAVFDVPVDALVHGDPCPVCDDVAPAFGACEACGIRAVRNGRPRERQPRMAMS